MNEQRKSHAQQGRLNGTKAGLLAVAILALAIVGCEDDGEGGLFGGIGKALQGGQCHNRETGEPLLEIKDAVGDIYEVQKYELEDASGVLELCGISVKAQLAEDVPHPELTTMWGTPRRAPAVFRLSQSGEWLPIQFGGWLQVPPTKGLRPLPWGWEWY